MDKIVQIVAPLSAWLFDLLLQ